MVAESWISPNPLVKHTSQGDWRDFLDQCLLLDEPIEGGVDDLTLVRDLGAKFAELYPRRVLRVGL